MPGQVREKLKDDFNGSEPPSAPHQSASAAAAKRKSKRYPSPASPSDESELARQEHGHKALAEQERIDALDATWKKVDEAIKEIHDFLEQMKRRKQMFLEGH